MDNVEERILKFLETQEWPTTTRDVAKAVNITWNTAEKHLLRLYAEREIKYKKVGGRNLWWYLLRA